MKWFLIIIFVLLVTQALIEDHHPPIYTVYVLSLPIALISMPVHKVSDNNYGRVQDGDPGLLDELDRPGYQTHHDCKQVTVSANFSISRSRATSILKLS